MKNTLILLLLLSACPLFSEPHPKLEPYPQAEEGMTRAVIVLEEKENEEDYRLELIIGKNVLTDVINVKSLSGRVLEASLKGWGYPYYVAERGKVITTLMAPDRGEAPQERFVAMPGKMIRYNSKLPVVVYLPEDMDVRYRIWRAGQERRVTRDN